MDMLLDEFNQLGEPVARAAVTPCLAVPRWVDEVVSGRPYPELGALLNQASASAQNLTDDELATALADHPRLGAPPDTAVAAASFSRAEQTGIDAGSVAGRRLRQASSVYEERFGHVFLIRAAGRSETEILAELERRLCNDQATERREMVGQLREIALRRLGQVVER
jgi:2-oxo-4-hydroxy-4-carboxy-5-ureidoimidazoline decarboxylase